MDNQQRNLTARWHIWLLRVGRRLPSQAGLHIPIADRSSSHMNQREGVIVDTYLDASGNFDVKLWAAWAEKRGYLPWQMTLAEYSAFLDRNRVKLADQVNHRSLATIAALESERLSVKRCQMENHRRDVERAFEAGKPVRPEVLDEYNLGARQGAQSDACTI